MAILEVNDIHTFYGDMQALYGVSLTVDEGEIVTMIGANGAGKTTTLKTISGILTPRRGKVIFKGEEIQGVPAHKLVSKGLVLVPDGHQVFPSLTVFENLKMGSITRKDREKINHDLEWVFQIFPRLKERTNQIAGTLSGGERQMLSIARALMADVDLLLLDEPSMGLAPFLVREIFDVTRHLNKHGVTILIVEQNAPMAFSVAERSYVIETGRVVLEGTVEELRRNPKVKTAYLGG
ncbi:MAG: ABC transporter ATP-binding protein [Spirochaetes bacterium]|nr:MAG: ABC transporter ATP-binding protein [Spirochaetota bacterium]